MLKLKRVLIIFLCIAVSISIFIIPSSAAEYCNTYGHDYRLYSHGGSGGSGGPDSSRCSWDRHAQCFYRCYYCGSTTMMNHDTNEVFHNWGLRPGPNGGYLNTCLKCGYQKYD